MSNESKTDNLTDQVIQLYIGDELSLRAVGEKVELSHEQVRQILISNDIQLRPVSRPRRSDLNSVQIAEEYIYKSPLLIAEEKDASVTTIYRRLEEAGTELIFKGPRPTNISPETLGDMGKDYGEGMTFEALSEKYGEQPMKIHRAFVDANIPTRPRGVNRKKPS